MVGIDTYNLRALKLVETGGFGSKLARSREIQTHVHPKRTLLLIEGTMSEDKDKNG